MVHRALQVYEYNDRIACKKSYISKKNYFRQGVNLYKRSMIFATESKFNVFGSDEHKMVWCKINEELKLKTLKPIMKHVLADL